MTEAEHRKKFAGNCAAVIGTSRPRNFIRRGHESGEHIGRGVDENDVWANSHKVITASQPLFGMEGGFNMPKADPRIINTEAVSKTVRMNLL